MQWRNAMIKKTQLQELILQSLEHERGGVEVYEAAIACATREDLREEWQKYLEQTRKHVQILQKVCKELQIDPEEESPGKDIVRHLGAALVQAMKLAEEGGDPAAAELVACECVVLAETKDHADWQLLEKCAEKLKGKEKEVLTAACEEVEDEEDEHLYHTQGWARELWLHSLGLEAVMPPPEEERHVKTAIGASRAQQASERERTH
jgi:rubrerythrin